MLTARSKINKALNNHFSIDTSNISNRNNLVPGETYAIYKSSDFTSSRPGSRSNPIITKYIGPIGVSGNMVRFESGYYQLGKFDWMAIRLNDYMTRKKRAQLTKPRYFTNGTTQSIREELESRGPYNPKRVEKLLELYPNFLKNNFENLEVVVHGVGKGPRTRKNRKTRKSRRHV